LHSIGCYGDHPSSQPECVPDGGFELTDLAIGELGELLGPAFGRGEGALVLTAEADEEAGGAVGQVHHLAQAY
jgi:hypothetical protein